MDDAGDLVPSHHIDHIVAGCDIERLDKCAFADLAFDEIRLSPHAILREHDLLACIQEASGRVEADKSQATGDQNHDATFSTDISLTSSPAFVVRCASQTTVDKNHSHVCSIAQVRDCH